MNRRGLIDTSTLIAGLPTDIIQNIEEFCSSTIVRAELMQGLQALRDDPAVSSDRVVRRYTLIKNLDAITGFWMEFDLAASNGYGILTASSKSEIRLKDVLIAGHALWIKVPVITHDAGFSRFHDVEMVLMGSKR